MPGLEENPRRAYLVSTSNIRNGRRERVRKVPLEAPGIEAHSDQPPSTIERQSGTIGTDAVPADAPHRTPKCAIGRGVETESSEAYDLTGVVETALARALVLAAEAQRWDVVMQIATELQNRRAATTGVVRPVRRTTRC